MNTKKILGIIAAMLVVAAAVIGAGCVAEQPSTPDVPEIPVENPGVTYTVTFAAGTGGTVSPGVVADVPEGSLIKVNGAMITVAGKNVTASAENGYEFSSWSAAVGAKDTSNVTITAEFTKVEKKKSYSGSSSGGNTAPVNAVEADENWTKNGGQNLGEVDRLDRHGVPGVVGVKSAEAQDRVGVNPAVDEPAGAGMRSGGGLILGKDEPIIVETNSNGNGASKTGHTTTLYSSGVSYPGEVKIDIKKGEVVSVMGVVDESKDVYVE